MRGKIPMRYRGVLFALLMSCSTALMVSAAIVYLHEPPAGFVRAWLTAFATAWPLVFVAILLIAPQVNRLVDLFVVNDQ